MTTQVCLVPAHPRPTTYAADLATIRAAAERIAAHAHRTPVMTCATLDALSGRALFFKCEHLQRVGAFKFRGACNAIARLGDEEAARGVVTHSSGNHAQAVALAARMRGIAAHIVMPTSAPTVKRRAVEGYGGRVVLCPPNPAAREATAARVQAETGATLVHPHDHPDVIAGQGTVALELHEQVPELDAVVVPVGGGGLLAGVTLALRELAPQVAVYAAEPAGADDAARSRAAGRLIPQTAPDTVADGLLVGLGEHTWPVVRDLVRDVLVVDDDAILDAMRLIWTRMKQVVEPSAADPLAAVLGRLPNHHKRVRIVLSGGNVDPERLPWNAPRPH